MNLAQDATVDQLRDLVAHCKAEEENYSLWVDQEGEVHLTAIPHELTPATWASQNRDVIRFRFETFQAGEGYLGPEAASNENWMNRLFTSLIRLWEAGATGYRDHG